MEKLKDLKVVFMGTPEFSVPILEMLIENTNVIGVVSREDAEVGRKRILTPSPVKACALKHGIKVFTPHRLKNEYEDILNLSPDIIITCAYGQIVPKIVLDYPLYGCINVHGSVLPKYRGASPIQTAIMNGEEKTGITIMYMDESLDTGNIINYDFMPIEDTDTYGTLSNKLSILGRDLLLKTLPKIIEDDNFNIKQDDYEATFTKLIKREDERLNFNKTTEEVYNYIRALNPNPLANTLVNGEEWKIIESKIGNKGNYPIGIISHVYPDSFAIGCLDGELLVTKIKPAGKKEMLVKDFFNGFDSKKLLGIEVGK